MIIGNYTFQKKLGEGGMATVYLADHNTLNQSVAVKLLNKEFVGNENIRKRFLSEGKSLFKMSHPNIIKVTDLIDQEDQVAIVMEYLDGETLKEYIERKGKLTEDELKGLVGQMLDALAYVHDQGLVHRDIKPSNFMLSKKGAIKLLDFGIAKNTDKSSSDYTQTGTLQSMGTPMYMSPEQVKSTKDVTGQSDIYSLGVVLWQMVTGIKPYDTNTTSSFELQTKIVNEPLSITNTKFDSIIQKATAKTLEDRYKNCGEMKVSLGSDSDKSTSSNNIPNTATPKPTRASDKTLVINNDNTVLADSVTELPKVGLNRPEKTKPSISAIGIVGIVIGGLLILSIMIFGAYSILNRFNSGETEYTESNAYTPDGIDSISQNKSVSFNNNSNYEVSLAIAYYDNDNKNWRSVGWFNVKPGESYSYALPNGYSENNIYWYGKNVNEQEYKGNDASFCIDWPNAFDYNNKSECIDEAGFHLLELTGNVTNQDLTH